MTTADEQTKLCFMPAGALAARIRRRDISPVEVIDAYLARIERRNPVVNAYTLVLGDAARAAARAAEAAVMSGGPLGPLHGVPVAIKDLDDISGVETSMGSRAVAGRVPTRNTVVVERLLAAGAILLGKTNTPEFGHKGTTDNLRFGPTSTPFKIGYNAGGSSGGSAAAVADGLAALAQGTDGGGSIRIPAAASGAVGFKASFGRIPSRIRPDAFLWAHPLVHIGPIARTVADAALMTQEIAGPHPRDPLSLPADDADYLRATGTAPRQPRIAFCPRFGDFPVDPAVAAVILAAISTIASHGIAVDEVEIAGMPHHGELAALWVRTMAIHYKAIAIHLKAEGTDLLAAADRLTPEFRALLDTADRYSAVGHVLDDLLRSRTFDALQDVFDNYDLIVTPTLAVPTVRNAKGGNTVGPSAINGEAVDPLIGWCMTFPLNFTGHPAISVPAGLTPEGLPVGLQIIGRRHADRDVLAMAAAFELMQPWFAAYPGLVGGA